MLMSVFGPQHKFRASNTRSQKITVLVVIASGVIAGKLLSSEGDAA